MQSVLLFQKRHIRQSALLGNYRKHFRKAAGILDLILHMIMALKNRVIAHRISIHNSVSVFKVLFNTAELKIGVFLQCFRQRRERFILNWRRIFPYLSALPAAIKYGFIASSSHRIILLSVPPFERYRLFTAKYKNGVIIRRVAFPICANCPPVEKNVFNG